MIDRTLTRKERTISECNLYWSDWLPEGEYKIIFRNRDGSRSKVHVATKLLE